jgi:carbon-monoxide dehydrogenase small subunit
MPGINGFELAIKLKSQFPDCGILLMSGQPAAADLLARTSSPSDDEIRHAIEGNICRCTGYHNIVAAIREAAATMAAGATAPTPAATPA